jgi:hypothetical protein
MKRPSGRHRDQPQSQPTPDLPGRSVAAGGDISGIASAGDDALNVLYRAERMTVLPAEAFRPWAELAVPPGLSNLPVRPGLFVGRAGELARLDAALAGPGGVVVQAVHGLGGIGKSTLAAHWAAARASEYTLTWWITAATPPGSTRAWQSWRWRCSRRCRVCCRWRCCGRGRCSGWPPAPGGC